MAELNKPSFEVKYTGNTGGDIFADAKPITAADLRELGQDITDSIFFNSDETSNIWKGLFVHLKTVAALPAYTVGTGGSGEQALLANSNGALTVDGVTPSFGSVTYVIVSEESPTTNNGVYRLFQGSVSSPWILSMRADSQEAVAITKAIYYVLNGTVNSDTFFRQETDNSGGTITGVVYQQFGVKTKTISISSAQILNSNSSPIELVPAPGANKYIQPIAVDLFFDYNSIAYATNTTAWVRYGTAQFANFDLSATADSLNLSIQGSTGPFGLNQAMDFFTTVGNPTAGNSTIKIVVTYRIISLA